jgi:hypothetical protein
MMLDDAEEGQLRGPIDVLAPYTLEIPRTKRRRPTLNAFSAIEVLVPYSPDSLAKARMRVIPGDIPDVKEVGTTAELEAVS